MNRRLIKQFNLKTLDDVKDYIRYLIFDLNLVFHPDTPFKDYVNGETKEPIFDKVQCGELNAMLFKCFKLCSKHQVDIYGICIDVQEREDHIQTLKACEAILERAYRALNQIPNKRIDRTENTYAIASDMGNVLKQLNQLQALS